MNPIFGLSHDIGAQVKKIQESFPKKIQEFLAEYEGVIPDDGIFVGPKNSRHAVFLEREWYLYFLSVLRSMNYE